MIWFYFAFSSAILSAAAAISQKRVLFKLDALEFSFVVSLVNMLLSAAFFTITDFSAITSASLLVLYLKTILASLAFLCVMLAIKNMDISGALPLLVVTPGLVALGSFFLLGESLSVYELSGMFLLLAGTYIIEFHSGGNLAGPFSVFIRSKKHHYIIFALLLFTTTSILDKTLLRDFKLAPYPFMAFQQIFFAFNFLIMILISKKNPVEIIRKLPRETYLWIVMISIFTTGYRYSFIEAVKIAPVALVLSVKRISVFIAVIFGGRIFSEKNILRKTAATVILLSGAFLILYFQSS